MTTKFFDRLSKNFIQLLEEPVDYNVSIEIGEASNQTFKLRLKFAQIYRTNYQVKNLAKHPSTIFESENFYSLSEDALMSIIKRDDLQLVEAKNPILPTDLKENFLTLKTTFTN
ncbi:hypothetical protein Glove_126g15 [Diversispora epigaea]|uniref:BTB domain-containing protein n=1 Tax=Diversispora epigaea TaxID=1348612 RepID=A0A397J7Q1_9GLOM|nr:hypothetical protein Glove_126g15 [Diversispora epigaea]